ncbi:hypothetical protein U1Q18_017395 [Sarracenia purpurea var. burkii]
MVEHQLSKEVADLVEDTGIRDRGMRASNLKELEVGRMSSGVRVLSKAERRLSKKVVDSIGRVQDMDIKDRAMSGPPSMPVGGFKIWPSLASSFMGSGILFYRGAYYAPYYLFAFGCHTAFNLEQLYCLEEGFVAALQSKCAVMSILLLQMCAGFLSMCDTRSGLCGCSNMCYNFAKFGDYSNMCCYIWWLLQFYSNFAPMLLHLAAPMLLHLVDATIGATVWWLLHYVLPASSQCGSGWLHLLDFVVNGCCRVVIVVHH